MPYDPEPPMVTSGLRLGTPALTTRGMEEKELEEIGEMIGKLIKNSEDESLKKEVRERVEALMEEFDLYRETDIEY
ncbi:serine hydroxymethyltransferase [Candidatus Haloredivivus sp. G17]|nr:serine hydroxymethyltransferase [Candidatus Haloredivivus sp. G17]